MGTLRLSMGTTTEQKPWLAEGEEKRRFVRDMFADIAPSYDLLNDLMCFRQHRKWRRAAVLALDLKVGDSVLDVCSGTGDFLTPLRAAVGSSGLVVGMDFCPPMLEKARVKFGLDALLGVGDTCQLPVGDAKFDAVTVGWGLRNVPDVPGALSEIARVLKPGGRFVTVDMARPRSKFIGRTSEFVFHKVVPWMGKVFGKSDAYTYLPKSTERFMSRTELTSVISSAGFYDVRTCDFFFGNICMHWAVKK